jgi:undecaprenyl-diphosphatase
VTHVWAAVLGLVQGLAEFLPISSSAHLTLIPWAIGLQNDPALAFTSTVQFDIALHAGSALAILIALWADWVSLAKGVARRERRDLRFAGFLLATSVPGAIFGVLLEDKVKTVFRAPWLIGCSLIVFGVLLWAVDRLVARQDALDTMTWRRAAWIGLAQAVAIVPGVSRSGATITAGRALGLSREAVARYSFMAALPIIAGGAVFGLRDVPVGQLLSVDWALGFAAAAISSFVLMRWMLAYVHKHSFALFMWYRIALGAAVIALFLVRG